MVLSGTLREFILADVMQLLTQQKITGKLILNNNRGEGVIIFKNGTVVAAARETETFTNKLFYYLTTILHHPRNKIREIFSSFEGKTAELTSFLEKKQVIDHASLHNYATSVTLDIACSLFLWTSGNYHFDSIPNVDNLIPANIDMPVENIVMEAMRRIDEWHRMREAITEETVFVPTKKTFNASTDNPLENPVSYFYSQFNGTQPVKALLDNSFQTEYKIYECCYSLLQSGHIRPMSETLTRSVHAAIDRSAFETTMLPAIVSTIATFGIVILVLFISWCYRDIIFKDFTFSSVLYRNSTCMAISGYHEKNAHLFVRYNLITNDSLKTEQIKYATITKRDLHCLQLKHKLMSVKQRK